MFVWIETAVGLCFFSPDAAVFFNEIDLKLQKRCGRPVVAAIT